MFFFKLKICVFENVYTENYIIHDTFSDVSYTQSVRWIEFLVERELSLVNLESDKINLI